MNIPKEFKGKIYIFWVSRMDIFMFSSESLVKAYRDDPEFIEVGEVGPFELPVNHEAAMNSMVSAIDREIEKTRAESAAKVQSLIERRNSLLAIEHQGAA